MVRRLEIQQGTAATHMLEPRTEIVSKVEMHKGTTETHKLES